MQDLVQQETEMRSWKVKSGKGNTLRSLYYFLDNHSESPYGIKFSTQDYSITKHTRELSEEEKKNNVPEKIHTVYCYPLYAVAKVMSDYNPDMKAAIQSLLE